jgi:hypothetical protein
MERMKGPAKTLAKVAMKEQEIVAKALQRMAKGQEIVAKEPKMLAEEHEIVAEKQEMVAKEMIFVSLGRLLADLDSSSKSVIKPLHILV